MAYKQSPFPMIEGTKEHKGSVAKFAGMLASVATEAATEVVKGAAKGNGNGGPPPGPDKEKEYTNFELKTR